MEASRVRVCVYVCVLTQGCGEVAEFNLFNVLNGVGYPVYQTM